MIRRPPRATLSSSSAASDVYKRQVLKCGTGAPHGHAGDQWSRVVEGRHRTGKAALGVDLRVAEEILGRHSAVVEHDHCSVGGADAKFVFKPLHPDAGSVLCDQERLDRSTPQFL